MSLGVGGYMKRILSLILCIAVSISLFSLTGCGAATSRGAQIGIVTDVGELMDKGFRNDGVWWYTFKSVIVFGKIRILTDLDEKIDKLTYLGDKFFPTHEETVSEINRMLDRTEVFEITIEHMSGKIVREK